MQSSTLLSKYNFISSAFLITFLLGAASLAGCDFTEPEDGEEEVVRLDLIAEGMTAPTTLVEPPGDSDRLLIADQVGVIYVVTPNGTLRDEPFLDIRDKVVELNDEYDERGLLGLAFHPNYENNGRFYVYYSAPLQASAPDDFNHTSHVSEFQVSADDPNKANPGSEQVLLKVNQPQTNHNAGTLAFGPDDGYLYVSLGDGGNRDDEGVGHVADWYEDNAGGNGQDVSDNLLGSILRLDVSGSGAYSIPPDNPVLGQQSEPDEQYAYGFRNPYRFSFDMGGAHDLIVGDAGQELWEEVSVVDKGGNYGWNVKEGEHCFDAENPQDPPASCPSEDPEGDPLIDPVIELRNAKQPNGVGLVVVGGYVYRGDELADFDGRYIFGVWSRGEENENHFPGRILVADPQAGGNWPWEELSISNRSDGDPDNFVRGFGQDQEGEVYVLASDEAGPTGNTGKVFKLTSGEEE